MEMRKTECETCGYVFETERKRGRPAKFCSDECRRLRAAALTGRPRPTDAQCHVCEAMFTPLRVDQQTCSKDCQAQRKHMLEMRATELRKARARYDEREGR